MVVPVGLGTPSANLTTLNLAGGSALNFLFALLLWVAKHGAYVSTRSEHYSQWLSRSPITFRITNLKMSRSRPGRSRSSGLAAKCPLLVAADLNGSVADSATMTPSSTLQPMLLSDRTVAS